MKRIFSICLVLSVIAVLTNCADRNRENPLDPGGDNKSPLTINLELQRNSVTLNWQVNNLKDYTGFRVYRSENNQSSFSLLAELPKSSREYHDLNLEREKWYYYYVTISGTESESQPSNIQPVMIGPGHFWILTRYGYSIQEYSYDLIHRLNIYNTEYPAVSWAWNTQARQIWLANAQFRNITRMNLDLGYEDFSIDNNFKRPIDVQWDQARRILFVLDQSGDRIYTLSNSVLIDSLHLGEQDYMQLLLSGQNKLWVLGDSSTKIYSPLGDVVNEFVYDDGYSGKYLFNQDGITYILTANSSVSQSKIILCADPTTSSSSPAVPGYLTIIKKAPGQGYFWAAEQGENNNFKLVKLSENWQRLLTINGLEYVTDFQINSVNQSIIVVERLKDKVTLFDKTGTALSANDQIYDPIKVLIR